jgi:hypothetical protein
LYISPVNGLLLNSKSILPASFGISDRTLELFSFAIQHTNIKGAKESLEEEGASFLVPELLLIVPVV